MANGHRIKLTAAEKVLLHLYEYTKYVDHFEVPFAVTQDGIAEAVGILRSHVPRTLKGLLDKGYIEEKLAHVIGSERRRKVYFLTTPGIAHAKKIRDDVKAVEWIFGLPEEKEEQILKEVMEVAKKEEVVQRKEEKIPVPEGKKTLIEGVCYLIEFSKQEFVFSLLRRELQGKNCLFLSRIPPQRIKSLLGDDKAKIYWLSGIESEGSVSATNLVRIFSIIKSFAEEMKTGFVIIDGLEYLIAQNGLDPIIKFIHMIEDFTISNNLTLAIPLSPAAVDPSFLALLEREFEVIREDGVSRVKETKTPEPTQEKPQIMPQPATVPGTPSLSEFLEKISDEVTSFHAKIPAIVHFFGRQEELRKIDEFINSKTHKFMIIHGIAGMGKTTLGAKVARNYVKKCNVFWLRIYDWVNLRTIVVELSEILFLLKRHNLKNYIEAKSSIDIGEVLGILERELKNTGLIVFIDDFQKVNEEIRQFFTSLLDVVAGMEGVKFILLSRHIVPFYDIRDVEQRKLVLELELKGLDKESTFEFLKLKGFPEKMFEQIYALTKGHPLALEFLKSPEDVKQTSSGIYKFIFNEIFMKLGETEKSFLKNVSVFRHPVSLDTITYTFPGYTTETITNLINRGLLTHVSNNHYEVHELVREFFYNMMSLQEKNDAHKRAAHYYLDIINREGTFSERVYLECAYHLYKTKDFEKLVDVISTNSFRLLQQGYIYDILELLENMPEIAFSSRIDMYVLKGTIYDILARWNDSLKAYGAALNIARNLLSEKDRAVKLMKLYERIGHVHYNRSEWLEGIKNYEESLKIARELNDASGIAYAEEGLALIYWRTGEYEKAKQYIKDALHHAEMVNDLSLFVNLKIETGMIYSELGDINSAISEYSDAIKYAEEKYFYYEMARAYHNIGGAYLEVRDFENSVKCYEKALDIFKKLGYFRETYWTMFNLAEVYIRGKGDTVKAEEYLKEAYVNLKRIGDLHGLASVHRYMGVAKRLKGDFVGAEENFKHSIEILEKLNLPHRLAETYFELGLLYKSQLRKDEAIECFEKAYSMFEKIGAKVYYLRKLYETMRA
ncbi:MAG: tetratricopeptide repeat protein [Thermoplasmata archaeon]